MPPLGSVLTVIASILGHESIKTTRDYLCLNETDQIGALEARAAWFGSIVEDIHRSVEDISAEARAKVIERQTV